MADWCANRFTVTGPPDELGRFAERAQGTSWDGHPIPLSFASHVPAVLGDRVEAWGTKWDQGLAGETDPVVEGRAAEGALVYYFNTAWWGPEAWLKQVAPLHPRLRFELLSAEPGAEQCGKLVYEGGTLVEEVFHQGDDPPFCDEFLLAQGWDIWSEWFEDDEP